MGNLIKPADYANKIGISRQAVYAKIKKGILSSKSVDGKLYIVLDDEKRDISSTRAAEKKDQVIEKTPDQGKLLEAKDETISVLKETVRDLKETNKMITSTLRGEVDLLKEAFGEMKMFYSLQLENKNAQEPIVQRSADKDDDLEVWMQVDSFYEEYDIKKNKKKKKILKELKKLFKNSDSRVDKHDNELVYLCCANFDDVLSKV